MSLVADAMEPLVLADGTVIDPSTGGVVREKRKGFMEIPSNTAARDIVVRTRRTVADLPLPPAQLSGVALVAFYTLFGLKDQEIAVACDGKLTVDQIKHIRSLEAYTAFMDAARENIVSTEKDVVRDIFLKNAGGAAMRIVEAAESDDNVLAFKASQDILDRAGHRPADIVEHRHKMEDALNIVVTRRDETQQIPMIDITPAKVIDNDSDS